MTHTAKVFISGNSQAVRLPKEFQFTEQEVQIQRVGRTVILSPISDPWESFRNSLTQFSEDFMEDGRNQPMEFERDMNNVFD
jgi:antitoxin VapB